MGVGSQGVVPCVRFGEEHPDRRQVGGRIARRDVAPIDDSGDDSGLDQHVSWVQVTVQPCRRHIDRCMQGLMPDVSDLLSDNAGCGSKSLQASFNCRRTPKERDAAYRIRRRISGRRNVERTQKRSHSSGLRRLRFAPVGRLPLQRLHDAPKPCVMLGVLSWCGKLLVVR